MHHYILYFCRRNAKIAQLVEHDLAKVGVAGSSPVFRSKSKERYVALFLCKSPSAEIGRQARLRAVCTTYVRVQVPPWAQKETPG